MVAEYSFDALERATSETAARPGGRERSKGKRETGIVHGAKGSELVQRLRPVAAVTDDAEDTGSGEDRESAEAAEANQEGRRRGGNRAVRNDRGYRDGLREGMDFQTRGLKVVGGAGCLAVR